MNGIEIVLNGSATITKRGKKGKVIKSKELAFHNTSMVIEIPDVLFDDVASNEAKNSEEVTDLLDSMQKWIEDKNIENSMAD